MLWKRILGAIRIGLKAKTGVRISPPPPHNKFKTMIIIAIEDFILFYLFFALLNCSIGAYLHHKGYDENDYFDTSYFTWFFLWWILLPTSVLKFLRSKFK